MGVGSQSVAKGKASAKAKSGSKDTKDKEKEATGYKSVQVRSGDVIVFCGKSRQLYHGIKQIVGRSSLLNGLASPGILWDVIGWGCQRTTLRTALKVGLCCFTVTQLRLGNGELAAVLAACFYCHMSEPFPRWVQIWGRVAVDC